MRHPRRQLDDRLPTAIFGGTFDPVHVGHLNLARQLLERRGLAQFVFVPAARPPHKQDQAIAPAAARLAMLELALAGEPRFFVSDFELRRRRLSYTVDTATHFGRRFGDRLFLVIGADSLRDLHCWHASARLVSTFNLLVYPRPGYPLPAAADLAARFGAANAARLLAAVVPGTEVDVSSTEIRARLAAGKSVNGLLPPPVIEYIQAQRLYGAPGAPQITP